MDGKPYRESLETKVFSVAKLKPVDFLKEKTRKRRQVGASITFTEARTLYEQDLENDHALSENSKRYRRYCIQKLVRFIHSNTCGIASQGAGLRTLWPPLHS